MAVSSFSASETATVAIELDAIIGRERRAAKLSLLDERDAKKIPVSPGPAELLALTVLAKTYGRSLLSDEFAAVRSDIAENGAIALIQKIIFYDEQDTSLCTSDLAKQLLYARHRLEPLCQWWPSAFFPDANPLLNRMREIPPKTTDGQDAF